jgi:hypothetical protein
MAGGRPEREFSKAEREEIKRLAALLMTYEDIALLKKCDKNTLIKHCQQELEEGKASANELVKRKFFTLINKKNPEPSAIYFYLKTQCLWRETNKLEIDGKVQSGSLVAVIEYAAGSTPPPTLKE